MTMQEVTSGGQQTDADKAEEPDAALVAPDVEGVSEPESADASVDAVSEEVAASEEAPIEGAVVDPARIEVEAARIRTLFAVAEPQEGGPSFRMARWGRPIRLAVFGAEPASAETISAALAEAAAVAGAPLADPDVEGAPNFLFYVCADWADLASAPGLSAIEPDLDAVLAKLAASKAVSHRLLQVSPRDGLLFAAILLRVDASIAALSGQAAALDQAARGLALFSEDALGAESPIALRRSGRAAFKGWFARLLGALYAEGTPVYSEDSAEADRLAGMIAKPARADREAKDGAAKDETDGGRRKRKRRRRRGDDETGDASSGEDSSAAEADVGDVGPTEPDAEQAAKGAEEEARP